MFKPFLTEQDISKLIVDESLSQKEQKRTPEQIEAIYFHGNNVLVSASAGSGKTFVMVERILDKLLRGISLNQMFISTFTVKAAGELKERLENKIRVTMAESNDSKLKDFLNAQLIELQTADIGTMDSFTQKLLTRYGYTIGISPNFNILQDKNEQETYQGEVFDSLFEEYMKGKNRNLFIKLVKNFIGNSKNATPFKEMVVAIHYFSQSTANPTKWLKEYFFQESYQVNDQVSDSLINQFKSVLEDSRNALEEITQLEEYKKTKNDGKPTAKYQKHSHWLTIFKEVLDSKTMTLGEMAASLSKILPSGDGISENKVFYPIFKDLKVLVNEYKFLDLILEFQAESFPMLELLRDFVLQFSEKYLQLKISENRLEFSDISHLSIEILEYNPLIRELYQTRYHEVMVDEYQDNNHIQERLLELLSNGQNRFMVGDIKQSIYRFRQADPHIFNQKFKEFQADSSKGKLIILKENFRSQIEVLESTNDVFTHLMDEEVGDINYDSLHQLKAGSESQRRPVDCNKTQLLIYNTDKDGANSNDDEEQILTYQEVEVTVKEILRLHRQENVKFSEITLLVSSRTRNDMILRTFREYGIPLVTDGGESHYLEALEIKIMLDTLRIIDNPLNDYALVALLKSPMFQFDEDDLTRIALQTIDDTHIETFFEKLENVMTKNSLNSDLITEDLFEKCQLFHSVLLEWRSYSKNHTLYQLIWKIYNQRYYFDYVQLLPQSEQAQANLYELALLANSYEKTGFKGLSRFIGMIDKMLASNNDLADVDIIVPDNAVTLMTIHKSKGLEFNYVFVLNCDKSFGNQDLKNNYILSRENGIGIKYLADIKNVVNENHLPSLKVILPTLAYQENKEEAKIAALSEQMRLLYVAMTRARRKLYLVGKGSQDKINDSYHDTIENNKLSKRSRLSYKSFQDWLLAIYYTFTRTHKTIDIKFVQIEELGKNKIEALEKTPPFSMNDQKDNRQSQEIREALSELEAVEKLNELYKDAISLPALRTPSQIKELYKDVFDMTGVKVDNFQHKENLKYKLPNLKEKRVILASEVGSAVHELMQAVPLDEVLDVKRLIGLAKGLDFDEELIKRLPLNQIISFFNTTELGAMLQQHSKNVFREAPFAMLKKDHKTLDYFVVRGIIDGYVLLDDRIVLFDYKTDKFAHSDDIIAKYEPQMSLYAEALQKSYHLTKVDKYLILLGGQDIIVEKLES